LSLKTIIIVYLRHEKNLIPIYIYPPVICQHEQKTLVFLKVILLQQSNDLFYQIRFKKLKDQSITKPGLSAKTLVL